MWYTDAMFMLSTCPGLQAAPGRRDEAVPVIVPLPADGPEQGWDEAFWTRVLKVGVRCRMRSSLWLYLKASTSGTVIRCMGY